MVQALLLIATSEQSLGSVYNVGTGTKITLNNLIELSQKIMNKKLKVKFGPYRNGDIKESLSDITKLKNIGYSPSFDLTTGMKKYLEYEFK